MSSRKATNAEVTHAERAAFARAARWLRINRWCVWRGRVGDVVRKACHAGNLGRRCSCAEIAESLSLDGMAVRG